METYTPFCCLGRRLRFISSYKYTIRFQDLCHASLSNVLSNRTFRHHTKRSFSPPSTTPSSASYSFFEFQRPLLFWPLSPFNLVPRDTFSFERVYKNSSAFSFHKSSQQSRSSRRLYSNFPVGREEKTGERRLIKRRKNTRGILFNSLIITVFSTILCSSI